MDADKPPYRVPTMAEIAALPPNGYKVASTFSGCGGSSTGYRMAGFQVMWVNEFVEAARDTYAANAAPYTRIDSRDIREVTATDVLNDLGMARGELDILDGSPPCASFSTAGKRQKGWGHVNKYSDTEQRSDDLFYEFARLVEGIAPRVFIAENVSGLVKGAAKGYFKEIALALRRCGYRVAARVLDAQWLGVPQTRQRLIFIGVREDLGIDPVHPLPLPYRYTVREALPWIAQFGTAPPHSDYVSTNRDVLSTMRPSESGASPTVMASGLNKGAGVVVDESMISVVHDTGGWANFSMGDVANSPCPAVTVGANGINSSHYQVRELSIVSRDQKSGGHEQRSFDDPAPTVMARGAGGAHHAQVGITGPGDALWAHDGTCVDPETGRNLNLAHTAVGKAVRGRVRRFTLQELRQICSFPGDFILTGTYEQRWERLGRAVPPVMMSHVAAVVRDQILGVADGREAT